MAADSYLFLTWTESTAEKPMILFVWMPVVVLLGLFCVESTAMLGADHTSGLLHAFVRATTGVHAQLDGNWSIIHHLIRKTGHFFGYGMLSLAWLRALLLSLRPGGSWMKLDGAWRLQMAAIAATFAVAGLDELHQSFLPNRTGKFSDVLLDTAGAVALQMVFRLGWYLGAYWMGAIQGQHDIHAAPQDTMAA